MPEFMGRERAVRLSSAPSAPQVGELYYDTAGNKLYWWNGSVWVPAGSPLGAAYATTIGDGSTTSFSITHNLGVTDVEVTVQETGSNKSIVYPEVQITSANGITVIFDVAPATNAYRVLVNTGANPQPPALVTTLPGSPVDGQEVYLQVDATNGINWHLRYRAGSASAYKWEFVGGPPILSSVTAMETSTGITTYGALTTAGPSVALPRAGDYIVDIGCAYGSDATGTFAYMSYDIGATGAVDADSITTGGMWVSGLNVVLSASRSALKTGLTAVTLTSKYKRSTGGTVTIGARWMRVQPVRLS